MLLTQHFDETIINDAFRFGARGFLHKNCTAQELKSAIDAIITQGYNNISEILKRMKNYQAPPQELKTTILLSERELEFLTLVCDEQEYTYEKMASLLGVSAGAVDSYRMSLFDRFGIKTKVGLVLFSFKYKLTDPFK